jgi:glycosyltransferase involved in cell wall biosynthesis
VVARQRKLTDVRQFLKSALATIVMRTVGGRPREIRRALASAAANSWRPLEAIVVYQGPEDAEWADIQRLPAEFRTLQVRVLRNGGAGDRRSQNLNMGWAEGSGRYIGFLDDDDTIEPDHVELLVQAMESSGRAWAYSQVILRKEDDELATVSETRPFRRHRFSLPELWAENFLPIHSLLIDRERLLAGLREPPFCEELDRSEDWDFLLRLAFHHEPAVVESFTCTYNVSTGTRNTNLSLMGADGDADRQQRNREAWARCKALVDRRKTELIAPLWWAREQFGIVLERSASPESVPAVSPSPQDQPLLLTANPSLRRRAVRKLIRMLERML